MGRPKRAIKCYGTVQLIYNGDIIDMKQFTCSAKRESIIKTWKKLYGKKFNEATIKNEE